MLPKIGLLFGLLYATSAYADCGCFCVEGRLQTLCTGVDAAAARPDLCLDRAPGSCPALTDPFDRTRYGAPVEGAENCRDTRIWDPRAGEYRAGRICDVAADAG